MLIGVGSGFCFVLFIKCVIEVIMWFIELKVTLCNALGEYNRPALKPLQTNITNKTPVEKGSSCILIKIWRTKKRGEKKFRGNSEENLYINSDT